MLNKISVAVKAILNDLKGIKADVSALQNLPRPRKGDPGKDALPVGVTAEAGSYYVIEQR